VPDCTKLDKVLSLIIPLLPIAYISLNFLLVTNFFVIGSALSPTKIIGLAVKDASADELRASANPVHQVYMF
jgi:hypothetical protein